VMPRGDVADLHQFAQTVQQKLEQVAGVSRVLFKESKDSMSHFTVESLQGRHIRPELARAVIESGWNLNELHSVGLSLEEIFLELTATPKADSGPAPAAPVQIEPPVEQAQPDGESK
jgi:hypothetical protein